MKNAFDNEDAFETHSIPVSEEERAYQTYLEYSKSETDKFLDSLPVDEHEPSTQYPLM